MQFIYCDGGRAAAGYKGSTGDCVCRSIAIAGGYPYQDVYNRLAEGNFCQRASKKATRHRKERTASHGIWTRRKWFKDLMAELGFTWTPTMLVGQGCKVHLADGELPMGRLVVALSRHYTAVIDSVIFDLYNPQREPSEWYEMVPGKKRLDGWTEYEIGRKVEVGGRCVYGYWKLS